MFLYLSPDWLSTVYKCVLDRDILAEAGWNKGEESSLITALKGYDSSIFAQEQVLSSCFH